MVSFPGDGLTLRGFLCTPPGRGAHPAVLWNHGSERQPGPLQELGGFFTSAGYVFFAPHRRGHGASPGEYSLGTFPARAGRGAPDVATLRRNVIQLVIGLYELHLRDIAMALRWLAGQRFVDDGRVTMSGVSHGGIQTLLAAEADLGAAAYIPFSPGAMAWTDNPGLRARLVAAVLAARAPMFLIQAENDFDLGPSEILGDALKRKGAPNAVRVYPAYGATRQSGHGAFACQGMRVWGDDVCAFLDQILRRPREPES